MYVHAQDWRAGSHTGFDFLLLGQNTCQLTHVMLLLHKDFYIYDATNYTAFNKAKLSVHGFTNKAENHMIYKPR